MKAMDFAHREQSEVSLEGGLNLVGFYSSCLVVHGLGWPRAGEPEKFRFPWLRLFILSISVLDSYQRFKVFHTRESSIKILLLTVATVLTGEVRCGATHFAGAASVILWEYWPFYLAICASRRPVWVGRLNYRIQGWLPTSVGSPCGFLTGRYRSARLPTGIYSKTPLGRCSRPDASKQRPRDTRLCGF